MALTFSTVKRNVVGSQREWIGDVTFDSSYPTGGEAFAPSDIDPAAGANATFHHVNCEMNDATLADVRLVHYDHANKKLFMVTTLSVGANAEAANASNQAAVVVRVCARYSHGAVA